MTKCTATRKTTLKKTQLHHLITTGNSSNQSGNSWVGGSRYPTIQQVPGNIGEGHCFVVSSWNVGTISAQSGSRNPRLVEVGRREREMPTRCRREVISTKVHVLQGNWHLYFYDLLYISIESLYIVYVYIYIYENSNMLLISMLTG